MDLSTFSDEELQRIANKKPTSVDLSGVSDEELIKIARRADPGAWAKGIGTQLGVGLGEGAIWTAGTAGDVRELAKKVPGGESAIGVVPFGLGQLTKVAPSSEQIRGAVEGVTGKFPDPQTPEERYARTFGQFAPSAAFPGSIPMRVAQWAIPALASETAGQATKGTPHEPYARAGAALFSGGVTSLAGRPGTAARAISGQFPDYVHQGHVQQAGALINAAGQRGITLTWPEALSQITGRPVLTDMQRILESAPQSRVRMQNALSDRPQAMDAEARRQFDALGPRATNPFGVGPLVGREAEGHITDVRGAINRAAEPYYTASERHLLNAQEMARVRALPGYQEAHDAIRRDPQLARYVNGLPENSVGFLNEVKKYLDQASTNAASPLQAQRNMQRSAGYGWDARAVRDAAVRASPDYDAALQIEARGRERFLDPLLEGNHPFGKLAKRDISTQNAVRALFSDPPAGSEGVIGSTVNILARRNPTAASQLVRQYAEMTFSGAVGAARAGDFDAARFAQRLVGNPQNEANLQAAITALPNGGARWNGFQRFLEIAEATGERMPIGSRTSFNTQELAGMSSSGAVAGALKLGASPGKWLTVVADRLNEWQLGRNLGQLADIITNPRSGRLLEQLARYNVSDPRAAIIASRLVVQARASEAD